MNINNKIDLFYIIIKNEYINNNFDLFFLIKKMNILIIILIYSF